MPGIRITSRESGFTLVELLIYMVMFLIVMGSLYSVMITNTKSYSSQENKVEMTQDLRAAMNIMVTEIRMAGCDPTDAGGIGFVDNADDKYDTDANSIHFTMDIDGDGAIANSENINYYVNGSQQIMRMTGDGIPAIVAENILNDPNATDPTTDDPPPLFFYRFKDGSTGQPNTTPGSGKELADIRSVEIIITGETANIDAVTGEKKTRTQTSQVLVRNAGF